MNDWIKVNVCVPTRIEQVSLSDSTKHGKDNGHCCHTDGLVDENEENLAEHVSFAQIIEHFLIENDLDHRWVERDEKYLLVEFCCPLSQMDEIVDMFDQAGIGKRFNSSYRISRCLMYQSSRATGKFDVHRKSKHREQRFLQKVKSQFAVQQVVEEARNAGTINFDYAVFLLCAGVLAATGLVENSSVILVASMLVSPIMGPILAATFGMSIRDKSLYKIGLKNEVISLGCCLVIGFFYELICSNIYSWHNGTYITEEMKSRGQFRSLAVGLLVALPSGVGVALSVLGHHVGSLVGVAISASLLPPMVNAGILFSLSLVRTVTGNLTLPDGYVPVYSNDINEEAAYLAGFSICLTLLNILCIVIMGLVILKVKEVVPKASHIALEKFWTEDLPVVREQNIRSRRASEADKDIDSVGLSQLFEEIQDDPVYRTVFAAAYRNPHGKFSPTIGLSKSSNLFLASIPEPHRRPMHIQSSISKGKSLEDFVDEKESILSDTDLALRKLLKRRQTVASMQRKSSTRFEVTKIVEEA